MGYATLELGQLISERTLLLDTETVDAYVEAVGDTSRPWSQDGAVPPMAVAALHDGATVTLVLGASPRRSILARLRGSGIWIPGHVG